jgi:hypothetical protein
MDKNFEFPEKKIKQQMLVQKANFNPNRNKTVDILQNNLIVQKANFFQFVYLLLFIVIFILNKKINKINLVLIK